MIIFTSNMSILFKIILSINIVKTFLYKRFDYKFSPVCYIYIENINYLIFVSAEERRFTEVLK